MDHSRQVTEAILDPTIQNTRVPSCIEGALFEGFSCNFSRGPNVSSVSGSLSRCQNVEFEVMETFGLAGEFRLCDDRVHQYKRMKEAWVHQRKIDPDSY